MPPLFRPVSAARYTNPPAPAYSPGGGRLRSCGTQGAHSGQ